MDYTPKTLRELAKNNKWDRTDLLAAADAWEMQEKSWLALLREISKLDEETTDWDGADDGTFLEEFDPWAIVRHALSLRKRLEAAEEKLALVVDVGFDYDGMASIEGLKQTIEKMVCIANGKAEEDKP